MRKLVWRGGLGTAAPHVVPSIRSRQYLTWTLCRHQAPRCMPATCHVRCAVFSDIRIARPCTNMARCTASTTRPQASATRAEPFHARIPFDSNHLRWPSGTDHGHHTAMPLVALCLAHQATRCHPTTLCHQASRRDPVSALHTPGAHERTSCARLPAARPHHPRML